MNHNLILDIGNTRIKCALFYNHTLVKSVVFTSEQAENELKPFLHGIVAPRVLISNVGHSPDLHFLKQLEPEVQIYLNHSTPLPITINYLSPETLGVDRIANAVGAFALSPKKNNLIIDAGTCLKFDFIDKKNTYQGGSIAPGLSMRFKAMHTFTENLPLITSPETTDLIGKNTIQSMQSGVINGMISEINGMISQYQSNYKDLQVHLTGGDMECFVKVLKNPIFADPFLTLKGLNTILQHV